MAFQNGGYVLTTRLQNIRNKGAVEVTQQTLQDIARILKIDLTKVPPTDPIRTILVVSKE
jgi:hypothetical protein